MAAATFARARQICERLSDPPEYLRVMHWLMVALAVRGELPQAREAAIAVVDLAAARGDRPALINAMRSVGTISVLMGQVVEACEWSERSGRNSAPAMRPKDWPLELLARMLVRPVWP